MKSKDLGKCLFTEGTFRFQFHPSAQAKSVKTMFLLKMLKQYTYTWRDH